MSFDSPFDHFVAGDNNAVDASAKHGWELFNTQARCNKCHALTETKRDPTLFTDNDFHNIGIGIIRHNVVALAGQAEKLIESDDTAAVDRAAIQHDMSVLGRFLITKQEKDTASFKTPDLRNVLVTGPYFHDGSQETLWDVMDHYNKGDGLHNPWLDEDMQLLALSETDIDDLVAFLASLTSASYKEQGVAELARQRARSHESAAARHSSGVRSETGAAPAAKIGFCEQNGNSETKFAPATICHNRGSGRIGCFCGAPSFICYQRCCFARRKGQVQLFSRYLNKRDRL